MAKGGNMTCSYPGMFHILASLEAGRKLLRQQHLQASMSRGGSICLQPKPPLHHQVS